MLKNLDKNQSISLKMSLSYECELKYFLRLKNAAELHIGCSKIYLPILRRISQPYGSENNTSACRSLRKGYYFLVNALGLVKTYQEYMPGEINDKNVQLINATLEELQFDSKHNFFTYRSCTDGCPVSEGQGVLYYKLLHSELKKDVRLFIEMVEHGIDNPVKRFLESVDQKVQTVCMENFFKAKQIYNYSNVENSIEEVAIFNSKDTDEKCPLHYAANNGNIDVINILLARGADATQVDSANYTPLYIAASKGYTDIVKVLIQHVSRDKLNDFINFKTTSDATTSLHIAAKNEFLDIVKFLLKCGAIYNIQNEEGKTPCDLSKEQNVINLLKLIGELFEDAKDGNLEIISKLKAVKPDEFEAVVNARNIQNHTLLQVAITNKHKSIASNLLKMLNVN